MSSEQDKIHDVQVENRHLRETICTMREKLETLHFEKEEIIQNAAALKSDEIIQMRKTVSALRDELEKTKFHYEAKLEEGVGAHRDEQKQLHQTITALRERLEKAQKQKDLNA